jgi:hypothetical protein
LLSNFFFFIEKMLAKMELVSMEALPLARFGKDFGLTTRAIECHAPNTEPPTCGSIEQMSGGGSYLVHASDANLAASSAFGGGGGGRRVWI